MSMWAASESSASEPVTNAVTASTTTKVTVSTKAIQRRPTLLRGGAAQGVAVVVARVSVVLGHRCILAARGAAPRAERP